MFDLFTIENFGNMIILLVLQAILGFDNLLYISIESQRVPAAHQKAVRFWGIIIAVVLRVVLLFAMIHLIEALGAHFYIFSWAGVLEGGVNFATCVFVLGGVFLMYTAVKEIGHLLTIQHLDADLDNKPGKSAVQVVLLIVLMNLIFSFDSVLSALAITKVCGSGNRNLTIWAGDVGLSRWCNRLFEEKLHVLGFRPVYSADCRDCTAWRKRSSSSTCNA